MSIQQEKFKEIADKIREKTGTTDLIAPNDFAAKIDEVYDKGLGAGKGDIYATDIIYATSYTDASGRIALQEDMFYPGQYSTTAVDGVHMLLEGEQIRYQGIVFTGKETALAVEYACYTGSFQGNFDVYMDAITDENLIATARNLDGGEWNWATVKTHQLPMLREIPEGVHDIYFVGHDLSVIAPYYENAPAWANVASGIRAFRFIVGEKETEKYATDEIAAVSFDTSSGIGNQQPMFFPGQSDASLTMGVNNLQDGNWVRYDDIIFTGNENVFSFDYATLTGYYQGNLDVYIDEVNEENLIASARNVDGGSYGWYTLKTNSVGLLKQVSAGSHSIIIVGLESTKGEEYAEDKVIGICAGISAFRFTIGKNATDEFVASEYSEAEGVGTESGMTFPGQPETSLMGINALKDGNWVRYDNIFFTGEEAAFSFDYATQNDLYLGHFDVYIDEISEPNLIASGRDLDGGSYGWSTVKTHGVVLSQTIPSGSHNIIIVGLAPTVKEGQTAVEGDIRFGIRAFRFVNAPNANTIGCIGDSITEGNVGVSYVPYFESAVGEPYVAYNFGKGGVTVDDLANGSARLSEAADAMCSDYLIVIGTNDANYRSSFTKEELDAWIPYFKENYGIVIKTIQSANPTARIFLATCPRILPDESGVSVSDNILTEYVVPSIKEVAETYGLAVFDLNGEMNAFVADGNELNEWGYGDALHFNEVGAERIGQFFADEFKQA